MVDERARLQGRGFGEKPALLVVGFSAALTDPGRDLRADMADEISQADRPIRAAHSAAAPTYLSTIAYSGPFRGIGPWAGEIRGLRELGRQIVAGCTSSGCLHACPLDACRHGIRIFVAREATADRLPADDRVARLAGRRRVMGAPREAAAPT